MNVDKSHSEAAWPFDGSASMTNAGEPPADMLRAGRAAPRASSTLRGAEHRCRAPSLDRSASCKARGAAPGANATLCGCQTRIPDRRSRILVGTQERFVEHLGQLRRQWSRRFQRPPDGRLQARGKVMNIHLNEPLIVIDDERKRFKISRNNFIDPIVFQAERERIFDRCWLYLGHASELSKPGDFLMRRVGGRSILFTKDRGGAVKAMYNTCPHRGAQVCRERSGNAKSFQCFYHGWVFGLDGRLRNLPGENAYPEGFKNDPASNLSLVKRLEIVSRLLFCLLRR